MEKFVNFELDAIDFDSAIDEVDVLVPKYLEAIECLENTEVIDDVPSALQNTVVYWERLSKLFKALEPMSMDVPFEDILCNTLKVELSTLEKMYLKINLKIEFAQSQWSKGLWKAADVVLTRMDKVLAGLGFPSTHEDRALIQDIKARNTAKFGEWSMRCRQAS